jgi:mRNA interferase MazF
MKKDFDTWNNSKKNINRAGRVAFCHQREIWWVSLGVNIGFEQDGTGENFDRPVIVMKGFNENIFWGIALTGHKRIGKYYFPIGFIDDREASVVLSQIRLIDSKRLVKKIGMVDEELFKQLQDAVKEILF